MAKLCNEYNFTAVLRAGNHWRLNALEKDGSIFSNDTIWTIENLDELDKFFVKNLDWGEGNFLEKLRRQLSSASRDTSRLAAEMLWLMNLCPCNVGPTAKRELVSEVLSFVDESIPSESEWLQDDILKGVGSAGTAFNTNRWRELVFFICFMRKFKRSTTSEQKRLLEDGWKLSEFLENIDESNTRQLRPMILFLLFPDTFERIFGGTHRKAIIASFEKMELRQVKQLTAREIDQKIYDIRRREQVKYPDKILDFYEAPLFQEWNTNTGPEGMKTIEQKHVLQAIAKIDSEGVPADAQSTYYDLIFNDRTYPPKYVISLAGEFANGTILDRGLFSGGEKSKAFRYLKKLGFAIEAKNALSSLVQSFMEQADEGVKLGTSSYLKIYRDLRVVVSFGKGNFARIPWIAFPGYGQRVSNGIYPVLLYFKDQGLLVLAYGVSETRPSEFNWLHTSPDMTISHVLASEYDVTPARYGTSYVKAIYKVPAEVNYKNISEDIDALIAEYKSQMDGIDVPDDIDDERYKPEPYSVEDALEELFIEPNRFEKMLSLLKKKKNIILQGPPGVGKTFACKRLAYALMEEKVSDRVSMVQFHQTYSYEDFIQGYRPSGTGFSLKDGIFYQFCNRAAQDLANDYVFIIDEINRGNLSKIFGELMLLVESDKRGPEWAIPLAYGDGVEDTFYVPENLYIIGLMNTADRSLAMVDYALRRRFGFVDILPGFHTEQFSSYLIEKGADPVFVKKFVKRIVSLNKKISDDKTNLGSGFCVGHSFFSALGENEVPDRNWYNEIVENEIAPLLLEYWFDAPEAATSLTEELLMRT